MNNYWDIFGRLASKPTTIFRPTSAMTPFIWLCTSSVPLLTAACVFHENAIISGLLVATVVVLIIGSFAVAVYFAIKDPDRLHTEEHIYKSMVVNLADKNGGPLDVATIDLTEMANPYPVASRLEHKKIDSTSQIENSEDEEGGNNG